LTMSRRAFTQRGYPAAGDTGATDWRWAVGVHLCALPYGYPAGRCPAAGLGSGGEVAFPRGEQEQFFVSCPNASCVHQWLLGIQFCSP
jgi:hypothetical protein